MPPTASLANSTFSPVVETTGGRIRGILRGGTYAFRGVPYGDTTAGAHRFLPPRPLSPWAGVRDMVHSGPSAPQLPVREQTDPFYAWYAAIEPLGEDCLALNVFTPAATGSDRPVMFWIHGGGWREFSGTAPGFDGTNLARSQDVVVVTVNHRLGAFGFLQLEGAGERFADSGNIGLLDLVAALRWVQGNAAAFGGDAGNVTIFGESGGASKIAALLAMTAAHGLFHKAILQSSGGGMHLATPEEGARRAAGLARALEVDRLDADALQRMPMSTLLDALRAAGGPFRGMIDGRNLTTDPFGISAPAISAGVPIMAGCTDTETTYHLRLDPANFSLGFPDVIRRLQRFLEVDERTVTAVVDAYRAADPDAGASRILTAVTSDFIFKRTTYRMAALQAAAGAAVYAYLFDRKTPVEGGILGSPHTTEVPFIFGTTEAAVAHVGTGSDIEPVAALMMASWASFARTGNPNNRLIPHWERYADADRRTMVLNARPELQSDPGGQARAALDELPLFGYGYSIPAFLRD